METEIAFMEVIYPQQIEELLSISKSLFGLNYHKYHYFKYSTNELIITACFNKKFVGFLKIIFEKGNSVKIDCIGISKNFQRKGIASGLLCHYFQKHHSQTNDIYALAWKTSSGIHAQKLFKSFKMKAVKNLGQIWKNKCNIHFQCPYNLNTCNCEAILFERDSI